MAKDSNLVGITAGARQQEGETRRDLYKKNRELFEELIPPLVKAAPNALFLIVSNPVDLLTLDALRISGLPENRVFGSGTWLDSARFQFHLSEKLCISPKSIDAYVLGEHGDTSFPVWSSATVAGKPLKDFPGFTPQVAEECYDLTRKAAYRIIHDLGYTCYSIGIVIKEVMVNVFKHSRIVVPLSVKLHDYYGHSDIALSVPCILDSTGIVDVLTVPLDETEQAKFAHSVETLRSFLK